MVQLAALLLRGVIAIFAGLLIAGGTLTLAADRANLQRPTLVAVSASPRTLTVPQVTGQAYVFAKGILEDDGFAWHVSGGVKGYAGNTVVDQLPTAGTVVLDTGAPTIVLTLVKNPSYVQLGSPESGAPYNGTAVRIPADPLARREVTPLKQAPRVAPHTPLKPKPAVEPKAAKSRKTRHTTASRTS
jgi:hypothetical protein